MKPRVPFHSNAVWPPLGMVAIFALAYGMLEGGLWIIERAAGSVQGQISSMPEIMTIRSVILGAAAGVYALFRLWRFHPACNLGYAAWLKSTPWTPNTSLPLGPVHLVWQDAIVIGLLAALARWHAYVAPTLPVFVFGLTYLITLTLLLAITRTWRPCLLLGFLWPVPVLPGMRGLPTAVILLAIILVTWYGHRASLRKFPWRRASDEGDDSIRPAGAKSLLEVQIRIHVNAPSIRNPSLGWPFQWLSPRLGNVPISASTSIAVSALFGWWAYCAMVATEMPSSSGLLLFFTVIAALMRLAIYCSGLGPSFNLWGRFASGRIIVPGFDQVFVTPLTVIILAIAGGVFIRHAGSWYKAATAFIVALVWLALLSGGPTLRRWVLTGQHRYRSPARLGANRQLLRPI